MVSIENSLGRALGAGFLFRAVAVEVGPPSLATPPSGNLLAFANGRAPCEVEKLARELFEEVRLKGVDNTRSAPLRADEPRLFEGAEVVGERRFADREVLGDLAGSEGAFAEEAKNAASGRVSKGAEEIGLGFVGRCHSMSI
jgi:hypothetical protein